LTLPDSPCRCCIDVPHGCVCNYIFQFKHLPMSMSIIRRQNTISKTLTRAEWMSMLYWSSILTDMFLGKFSSLELCMVWWE
jgi:hypothetical protein